MIEPVVAAGRRNQQPVVGFTGVRYLTTFVDPLADVATGLADSPVFDIDQPVLRVRVGGGSSANLGVEVIVDGVVVASARGDNAEAMQERPLDLTQWMHQRAMLRVRDVELGRWGHLQVDDVALCPR